MKKLTILGVLMIILLSACIRAKPTPLPISTPAAAPAPDLAGSPNLAPGKSNVGAPTTTPIQVSPPRKPQGTLTHAIVGLGQEVWSPTMAGETLSYISPAIVESLIYRDERGNLVPGLAEKWELSSDGRIYTFYLRKGIQFHDGWGEFTAEDVKFTFEKASSKDSINSPAKRWASSLERIDIVSPYQIAFVFKNPIVGFLDELAPYLPLLPIFSKKYTETSGEQAAARHPIGTGPYKFVEHRLGDYLKMEALDSHWRQVPYFKNVLLKVVPEQATRVVMLKTGEADIIDLSLSFKEEVKKAGFQIKSLPNNAGLGIVLGGVYPPTHPGYMASVPWVGPDANRALKVRKALNLAVNRQDIIDKLLAGEAAPGGVPPFFPETRFWKPDWKTYNYDPQEAKRLLADAGYPNGFEITMWLFPLAGRTELPDLGRAVATYWENIGVKVKMLPTDYQTVRPKIASRQAGGFAWPYGYLWTAEPFFMLTVTAYSKAPMNVQGFENPEIDRLIEAAAAETDDAKRVIIQKQIGQLIDDNYLWVPIAVKNSIWGVGKKVGEWPLISGATFGGRYEYVTPAR